MDVSENINNGDYMPKLQYPAKPKKPNIGFNATPAEHRAHADALEEHTKQMEAFKTAVADYNKEENRLFNQFQLDLEEEFALHGHPKADMLFSKAWERGHGSGFMEVYLLYADLSDLIK